MMKRIFATVAALSLAACVYVDEEETDAVPDPQPPLTQQQGNPQLALLDHVLAGHFRSATANAPTVCASQHDGRSEVALDQADEVLLMEHRQRLAPLSRCGLLDGGWQDTDTGEPATVFNLHSFTCGSDAQCSGWVSAQTGAAADMSYRYTMEWDGSEWQFARDPRLIADQ